MRNIMQAYTGWPKNKPLPNDTKIVLNHINACQWVKCYWSHWSINQAFAA